MKNKYNSFWLILFISSHLVIAKPVRIGIAGMTHGHVNQAFEAIGKQQDVEIVGFAEPNKELALGRALNISFSANQRTAAQALFPGKVLQAHHLISLNILKSGNKVLDAAVNLGFDFSGLINGRLLGPPVHGGSHPSYDNYLLSLLQETDWLTWKASNPSKNQLDYIKTEVMPAINGLLNYCVSANPKISINQRAKQLGH